MPKVHVTDLILRDAHQSLIATRMRTEDMLPICPKLDEIGFWSLEVWGGATFDVALRFLKEDPGQRLHDLLADSSMVALVSGHIHQWRSNTIAGSQWISAPSTFRRITCFTPMAVAA